MPLDLVYRADAREDLDNIFRHIAVESPERALTFVNSILDHCALLRVVPEWGRRVLNWEQGCAFTLFAGASLSSI